MKKIIENGMRRWDKESWLTIAGILAIIGAVVIGGCALFRVMDETVKSDQAFRGYVGSQVVIQGDTLLVVSTYIWRGTYILSNGVEVSQEIVYDNVLR